MYALRPNLLLRLFLPMAILTIGCQKEPAASTNDKIDSAESVTRHNAAADDVDAVAVEKPVPQPEAGSPTGPRRPEPTWAIFQEAYDADADADLTAKWTGGNRFEITSDNVSRVTLDLTRLPPEAPQTGPWVLQIDKQAIQITGARGKVLDLVRSRNGDWSVDKEKPPHREAMP